MSKLFILLFCCATLVSAQLTSCPSDQVYACRSPCGLTCATLYDPCIQVIQCSCYCRIGYTRLYSNGPCIPITSCPSTTG